MPKTKSVATLPVDTVLTIVSSVIRDRAFICRAGGNEKLVFALNDIERRIAEAVRAETEKA